MSLFKTPQMTPTLCYSTEPPQKKMKTTSYNNDNTNNNSSFNNNLQFDAETLIKSLVFPNWVHNKTTLLYNNKAGSSSTSKPEPFGEYFQRWLIDEERNLEDLRLATSESTNSNDDEMFEQLVQRVMCHYEDYYKVKSESVEHDVVYMLNAPWLSPLERTFLWIGGWRATTTFHLLYTVVGLQLEARLSDFLQGSSSTTTPENLVSADDLSPAQLVLIDELQRQTIRQERELNEALASLQEALVDSSMVQLSHLATTNKLSCDHGYESVNEQVKTNLRAKEDKLKEVFWKADELRFTMFKKVVDILTPIQGAHFLIAAAELHLRLHEWGRHN